MRMKRAGAFIVRNFILNWEKLNILSKQRIKTPMNSWTWNWNSLTYYCQTERRDFYKVMNTSNNDWRAFWKTIKSTGKKKLSRQSLKNKCFYILINHEAQHNRAMVADLLNSYKTIGATYLKNPILALLDFCP